AGIGGSGLTNRAACESYGDEGPSRTHCARWPLAASPTRASLGNVHHREGALSPQPARRATPGDRARRSGTMRGTCRARGLQALVVATGLWAGLGVAGGEQKLERVTLSVKEPR